MRPITASTQLVAPTETGGCRFSARGVVRGISILLEKTAAVCPEMVLNQAFPGPGGDLTPFGHGCHVYMCCCWDVKRALIGNRQQSLHPLGEVVAE